MLAEYGGRRAALIAGKHAAGWMFGRFGRYGQIDWRRVQRLIFVCKGNICRSAFAHALAVSKQAPLIIGSAGLAASPGTPADSRAITAASAYGIALQDHRATPIGDVAVNNTDLLVAFEPAHAELLCRIGAQAGSSPQITLLGLWSSTPWQVYLHDPYGLSERYFDSCFARIDDGVAGLLSRQSALAVIQDHG